MPSTRRSIGSGGSTRLINNAGIYIGKPFTDYTLKDYAAITAVNLTGFFHITQLAIAQMVEQTSGHVVNMSTSLVDHALQHKVQSAADVAAHEAEQPQHEQNHRESAQHGVLPPRFRL